MSKELSPASNSELKERATPLPKPTRWLAGVVQGVCIVGAVVSIIYFGALYPDRVVLAEALAATMAVLALFRFPGLTRFKALGVELEMKRAVRRAKEAAKEAQATINQLRTLAATLGGLELDNLALRNRMGVLPPRKLLAMRDRVAHALKIVGCSDDEVYAAEKLLKSSIGYDLASAIGTEGTKFLMGRFEKGQEDERFKAFQARYVELQTKVGLLSAAPASEYETLLDDYDVTDHVVRARLADYARYERTGEAPSKRNAPGYFDVSDH